jgi:hypothetical protein
VVFVVVLVGWDQDLILVTTVEVVHVEHVMVLALIKDGASPLVEVVEMLLIIVTIGIVFQNIVTIAKLLYIRLVKAVGQRLPTKDIGVAFPNTAKIVKVGK